MKKHKIFTIIVISVLALASNVNAQPGGNTGSMMGRSMMNIEAINTAITEIETQLAALKEAMEGAEDMGGPQSAAQQGNQADMQEIIAEIQKRQEAVQAAANSISAQLLILDNTALQVEIDELQQVARKATEEDAAETADLIRSMITERIEAAQALGVRVRAGGPGGPGGMGTQEPALPGGFEWID